MIDFSQLDSLIAMTMYFNNEATCRQAILEKRWGVGENQDIVCPYCGQHHCATRKDGKFRCNKCKRNFIEINNCQDQGCVNSNIWYSRIIKHCNIGGEHCCNRGNGQRGGKCGCCLG